MAFTKYRPTTLAAVAFVAVGAALFAFVTHRASVDQSRGYGQFDIGQVTEVVGDEVIVEYALFQREFAATAYPVNPEDFRAGDFVKIRFLPEEPEHVVLEDTDEASTSHLPGLAIGAAFVLVGVWLPLHHSRPPRPEGHIPSFSLIGRRHSA